MPTIINAQILSRHDTYANLTAANPVLGIGEIAVETDRNGKAKVGNGVSTYNTLTYIGGNVLPSGLANQILALSSDAITPVWISAPSTPSIEQMVNHNDIIDLSLSGFGKAANAVIDLTGGARTLSLGAGATPRGRYQVTFRGDGNAAHSVVIPTTWVSLGGPTAVNTANSHLTRVFIEYDADALVPTYILQDLSASTTAAGAIIMSGPSSGVVLVASTNFTVTANGSIGGSIIITPNDNSGGGTFTPTTVTLSSGAPSASFQYTPATTGVKTVRATNNSGLTNPTDIPYVSNPATTTTVTLTGPTSGSSGVISSPFTVGTNGAIVGTLVITPAVTGGGTLTPATINLTAASPTGQFTYTPASTGSKSISVTNSQTLFNPSPITFTSTGAATFFEDDYQGMTGVLNARTPNVSNANAHNWTDPASSGQPQYGYMLTNSSEGYLMQMGGNTYSLEVTAQLLAGQSIALCCKDLYTHQSHTNYSYDGFYFNADDGTLTYNRVDPNWTFNQVYQIGTGGINEGVVHVFRLDVDDTAHTAKFFVDNVQKGTTQTIRTNAQNDLRIIFPNGGFVTHTKCN